MTHPRRKLSPVVVRNVRRDYRARREAEAMVARGRELLRVTPSCNDYARELGTTETIILAAAKGLTYKDIS